MRDIKNNFNIIIGKWSIIADNWSGVSLVFGFPTNVKSLPQSFHIMRIYQLR